jgi:hypothetical protein
MARPFDLSGTWNMESVEGIEGFLADSGASWMKRKAAAAVLGRSKNPRRIEQRGDEMKSAVKRKGEWQEDAFTVNGERVYGKEEQGVKMWKCRSWDSEGWLVDEGRNHEGHLRMRFGLLDANTMEMRLSLVVEPPSGNEMVRVYSRDGAQLPAGAPIPRCESSVEVQPEPEQSVAAEDVDAAHAGSAEPAPELAPEPELPKLAPELGLEPEPEPERQRSPDTAPARPTTRLPGPPPPVVFIHGIMGSTLVDGGGTKHYLTVSHSLALHTPNLALPATWLPGQLHWSTHKGHEPDSPRRSLEGKRWIQGRDGLQPGCEKRHSF